jgi:hypothetical protein
MSNNTKNYDNTDYEEDSCVEKPDSCIEEPDSSSKEADNEYESDSDKESSSSETSEKPTSWPVFETNVYSYSRFSIANKMRLFKLVSHYWVYCNQKDRKVLPKAVGTSYQVIKDILHFIFIISSKKWEHHFVKRVNYKLFYYEYFQYINDTENITENTDNNSVIVRNKFANNKTNIVQKQNEIFMKILDNWISLKTNVYSRNEMKNIIINILSTEFNKTNVKLTQSILKNKFESLLKKFNIFIASSDFENANLLKNSQDWIYPKMYWIETNPGKTFNKKLTEISNKRKRNDVSYSESDSDSDSEVEIIQRKKPKTSDIVDMSGLSEFIDNLPSKLFLLLVYKDAINIKGEIKNIVSLSDEEKMSVSSEIAQRLIDYGIIQN